MLDNKKTKKDATPDSVRGSSRRAASSASNTYETASIGSTSIMEKLWNDETNESGSPTSGGSENLLATTMVEFKRDSILTTIVKILLKYLADLIRKQRFSQFGLEQLQVDCGYLKHWLWKLLIDEHILNSSIEEVVTLAVSQCPEPKLLDPALNIHKANEKELESVKAALKKELPENDYQRIEELMIEALDTIDKINVILKKKNKEIGMEFFVNNIPVRAKMSEGKEIPEVDLLVDPSLIQSPSNVANTGTTQASETLTTQEVDLVVDPSLIPSTSNILNTGTTQASETLTTQEVNLVVDPSLIPSTSSKGKDSTQVQIPPIFTNEILVSGNIGLRVAKIDTQVIKPGNTKLMASKLEKKFT